MKSAVSLALVILAGLLHLGVRLYDVQVRGAADYSYASARQSIRRVQVAGVRGRILDRRGRVLAGNRSALSITCSPEDFQRRTWEGTVDAICAAVSNASVVVGLPVSLKREAVRRHVNQRLARPLVIWRDIGEIPAARFAEHANELRGFELEETTERTYPQGACAAHLLGYVGRDRTESEAGDIKYSFYSQDLCGRAGLENYYDSFLRGVSGESEVTVDARGFAISERMVTVPQGGPDLALTIDLRIQRAAERQLAGVRGACVVLDPRQGDVLALASAPGFNPNDFVPVLRSDVYRRYADDPDKPLLNRACGGAYAPGSTFKPVVALAALTLGVPPSVRYSCSGHFEIGEMDLRCSSRWGHGDLDLQQALMKSCNPYFCNLGLDIGTNAILKAAAAFGLGRKTGLDFGVDRAGLLPDAAWKERTYGDRWYLGDVAQMSIGQGLLLVSPLQMALVAGAIGTGRCVSPRLKRNLPVSSHPLPFAAEHLEIVRAGMRMVVAGEDETRGTGWRAGDGVKVSVSGKTGTAEYGPRSARRKNTWFIAYAPSENPTVAVALIVEDGESGGGTAAPRVAEILKEVFR